MKKLPSLLAFLALLGAPAAARAGTVPPTLSSIAVSWDSNTTVANGTIPLLVPAWVGGGTISSVTYYTNGTSTPSFTASVQIGGVNVTGCNTLAVSSASATTAQCTGSNAFTSTSSLTLVVSSVSGLPAQTLVQINLATTQN